MTKKKEIGLLTVFYGYLLAAVLGAIAVAFLSSVLYARAFYASGLILPANRTEEAVDAWLQSLEKETSAQSALNRIPPHTQYALFPANGAPVTDMDASLLATAKEIAGNAFTTYQSMLGADVVRKITHRDDILVLVYRMQPSFANPRLRERLPAVDLLLLALSVAFSAAYLIALTAFATARLKTELRELSRVAKKIGARDLTFTPQTTRVKEFNQALSALNDMRDALNASLKREWDAEAETIRQSFALTGARKGLRLTCDVEDVPGELPLPSQTVLRIAQNLVDNAVQYAPENGAVGLRLSIVKNCLQIDVEDDGQGFSAEDLRRADEAFYRADKSRSDGAHHGLGLAIVKRLATDLGGALTLENLANGGAHARVLLPLPK